MKKRTLGLQEVVANTIDTPPSAGADDLTHYEGAPDAPLQEQFLWGDFPQSAVLALRRPSPLPLAAVPKGPGSNPALFAGTTREQIIAQLEHLDRLVSEYARIVIGEAEEPGTAEPTANAVRYLESVMRGLAEMAFEIGRDYTCVALRPAGLIAARGRRDRAARVRQVASRLQHSNLADTSPEARARRWHVDYSSGLSIKRLAEKEGVSEKTVREAFKQYKLPARRPGRPRNVEG